MRGGRSAIGAMGAFFLLSGCLEAGTPVDWPEGDFEAAFVLLFRPTGDVENIEGPYRVIDGLGFPSEVRTLPSEGPLFVLGLSSEQLRAGPGGYDPSSVGRVRIERGPESCGETGRLIDQGGVLSVRVPLPSDVELRELDRESGRFVVPTRRDWFEDWSLEVPISAWCDDSSDLALEPFPLSSSGARFSQTDELHHVARVDDDRMVVTTSIAIHLLERGRPIEADPRHLIRTDLIAGQVTYIQGLIRDTFRSTPEATVLIANVRGERRRRGWLLELTVDAGGMRQTGWTEIEDGSLWSMRIDPRGHLFGVGGYIDEDSEDDLPVDGLVMTATTSRGPFSIMTKPKSGFRTISLAPIPDAPHWLGTQQGEILEGDLERGLDTMLQAAVASGAIYELIALGDSEQNVQGIAMTSFRIPAERLATGWAPTQGFPLPPRVKDCEVVATPDVCGWRRWLATRVNSTDASPARPWEAVFTPLCDVVFHWDGRERCMSLVAVDLDHIDGDGRWYGSDIDRDGRRLTVVGSAGRIYEVWFAEP